MKRKDILTNTVEYLRRVLEREKTEGRPIPSTDALVEKCGVSRGTVERALRQLRDDGAISMKRRTTAPTAGFSYRDDDEWDVKVRQGSDRLLAAIRQHHPDRLTA